ncbi:unnamed protein product [Dovyalis caffra]|uniref:CCHC-type domain-containing protein n=1 Tax=Dovyalis caffra TaxID=77055 RepID=A0AAV1RCS6_9ROSI|nr:unnamed protein product [Dovyalis caffra]
MSPTHPKFRPPPITHTASPLPLVVEDAGGAVAVLIPSQTHVDPLGSPRASPTPSPPMVPTCYNCRGIGHLSSACPLPNTQMQLDHLARPRPHLILHPPKPTLNGFLIVELRTISRRISTT